jgi:hypothetical protein
VLQRPRDRWRRTAQRSARHVLLVLTEVPMQTRLDTLATKATEMIKAHPVAAIAAALGLGYLVTRMVRR